MNVDVLVAAAVLGRVGAECLLENLKPNGLTATRYLGKPDSEDAVEGLNRWIGVFAAACGRAVEDALAFEERIRGIQGRWRKTLGSVRRNSAVDLLVAVLPGAPIEARAVLDAFGDLERQLASPSGDTRASPQRRPATQRSSQG